MRRLLWSQSALDDFDQAIGYLAMPNPGAAERIADRIDEAAIRLADTPIGRPGRVTGTYEKHVLRTPCIIAYRLSEHDLTIVRVIHGKRDWPDEDWPG